MPPPPEIVSSGRSLDSIIPKADFGEPIAYVSLGLLKIVTQSSSSGSTCESFLVWKVRLTVSWLAGSSTSKSSAIKSDPLVAVPHTDIFIIVSSLLILSVWNSKVKLPPSDTEGVIDRISIVCTSPAGLVISNFASRRAPSR